MSVNKVLNSIAENDIEFVDFRFTDTKGKEQHVTFPVAEVDEELLEKGTTFDGSSIAHWKEISESDTILQPDLDTIMIDPFAQVNQLNITCNVIDPITMKSYNRSPRAIAKRAEYYLQQTGIADACIVGPEPEFFVLDDVRWGSKANGCFAEVNSEEGYWASTEVKKNGNLGHRPGIKGGYFPVPPVDSLSDFRSEVCCILTELGLKPEVHHHEVATAGQCEIGVKSNSLVKKADEVQVFKYVVHNTANIYGKTATFMPKPLVGDNGSGMHINMSLSKNGKNTFAGKQHSGLSEDALLFIGGILKHSRSLNAFTNPGTNSYKRLVPGFEAPVILSYSANNRSASIRIPLALNPKETRVELRYPDPSANPYLAFSAVLMAGIDGIKNKIHPGKSLDKNLYDISAKEEERLPTVCITLPEALKSLQKDHKFLLEGDVFSKDMIDAYISLKMEDVQRLRATTHPIEYEMYYSV